MERVYQEFIELLKKFPYGERFLEHGREFVGGSCLIWVVLTLIVLFGSPKT